MNTNVLRARPTVYNGIEMRSRLEARYAAWLDRVRIKWEYEPNCFADSTGQYLPDFRLTDVIVFGTARTVYVDVKPTHDSAQEVFDKMSIIWSTEPDAFLAVDAPPGLNGFDREFTVYLAFPPALSARDHVLYQLNAMWCLTPPNWTLSIVTECTEGRWDHNR